MAAAADEDEAAEDEFKLCLSKRDRKDDTLHSISLGDSLKNWRKLNEAVIIIFNQLMYTDP